MEFTTDVGVTVLWFFVMLERQYILNWIWDRTLSIPLVIIMWNKSDLSYEATVNWPIAVVARSKACMSNSWPAGRMQPNAWFCLVHEPYDEPTYNAAWLFCFSTSEIYFVDFSLFLLLFYYYYYFYHCCLRCVCVHSRTVQSLL